MLIICAKSNVLVDEHGNAALSGFGMVELMGPAITFPSKSSFPDSVRWFSPELLGVGGIGNGMFTKWSDIYAFAMLVLEESTLKVIPRTF